MANGKARVPQEISPNNPTGWYAQKRSTLPAALVFASPGIPMIFEGQEFLEGGWFRDNVPVDWDEKQEFSGIVRLYRDLIRLRLNREGFTGGLCVQSTHVYHLHDGRKVIALHRWDKGGPAGDVVVVASFFHEAQDGYVIGFPASGSWKLRFRRDAKIHCGYLVIHQSMLSLLYAFSTFGTSTPLNTAWRGSGPRRRRSAARWWKLDRSGRLP